MADMMERFIESTRAFYPAQGLTNVQDYGGIGTSCQSYVTVNNSYGAPMWSKIFVSCNLCAHSRRTLVPITQLSNESSGESAHTHRLDRAIAACLHNIWM